MNKESRPLTQDQRKEFVQLLKDAKVRVLENLSDHHSKRYAKAWHSAVAVLMQKLGATKLFEKATAAKKDLKDTEKALRNLGFRFDDDGELELTSDGSALHGSDLREEQTKLLEDEVEAARKSYEKAILNVLATENVEEAKGIVEPLV
jgi:hypothetical protein